MKELDYSFDANDPVKKKCQINQGNMMFPNLLSSAGNWIETYVGKEDSCWPSEHSIRSKREKSEINVYNCVSTLPAGLKGKEEGTKVSGLLALPASNLVANPSCLEADVTTSYNNK